MPEGNESNSNKKDKLTASQPTDFELMYLEPRSAFPVLYRRIISACSSVPADCVLVIVSSISQWDKWN